MESKPSPSTNNGASASMSAGVISSSCSTSMIIRFISSSNACMDALFLCKKIAQVIGQAPHCQYLTRRARDKRLNVDLILHFDVELRPALRQFPPTDTAREHERLAADQHR